MHASVHLIRSLFGYMIWADNLSLAAAAGLTEDEYFRERGISAGSIHKLLVHLMGAEWIWLQRWHGTSPIKIIGLDEYPDRPSLEARWPDLHRGLMEFVEGQTDESLSQVFGFRTIAGDRYSVPLGQAMLHLVDHGSYHRGQLNTMLKQAGAEPAPAFLIRYHAQQI